MAFSRNPVIIPSAGNRTISTAVAGVTYTLNITSNTQGNVTNLALRRGSNTHIQTLPSINRANENGVVFTPGTFQIMNYYVNNNIASLININNTAGTMRPTEFFLYYTTGVEHGYWQNTTNHARVIFHGEYRKREPSSLMYRQGEYSNINGIKGAEQFNNRQTTYLRNNTIAYDLVTIESLYNTQLRTPLPPGDPFITYPLVGWYNKPNTPNTGIGVPSGMRYYYMNKSNQRVDTAFTMNTNRTFQWSWENNPILGDFRAPTTEADTPNPKQFNWMSFLWNNNFPGLVFRK